VDVVDRLSAALTRLKEHQADKNILIEGVVEGEIVVPTLAHDGKTSL
jgi:hypothetical protein